MSGWGSSHWGADPYGSGGGSPTPPGPVSDVISTFTLDGEVGAVSPGAIGTSETLLEGQIYNVVCDWDLIPGSQLKIGVSGRFVTGSNPVTLRVRIGGRPTTNNSSSEIVGTIVFSAVLPANTTTDLGAMGALVSKPTGKSNWAVTAQASGGSSTLASTGMVVTATPDDGTGRGLMLSSGRASSGTVTEQVTSGVGYEWLVDFDVFSDATNLTFGFAAYEDPAFGGNQLTARIRVGGTTFTANGTEVLAVVDPNTSQSPYEWIIGGSVAVANAFSGPQLVKLTWAGRAGPGRPTLIIVES